MAKYYIQREETFVTVWEAEADSKEEALRIMNAGDADIVENWDEEYVDVWLEAE